jgi:succinoglycan biosynthesis protein ExoA
MTRPTVTVAIPVLNERAHIDRCLESVESQTYDNVVEILVVDGGSTDDTRPRAARHRGVRVLDNPKRIQAAGLNVALKEAAGDIVVRVDGHCILAPDYVERCVDALITTDAAVVGGGMRPEAEAWFARGVAAAMQSRLGAGPAQFHVGGRSGWVDTVYLGAYRRETARRTGGYAESVGVNEDAEFAYRMGVHGGVWFDETIHSTYTPRSSMRAVARQFFRYGRSRAATARRHPGSIAFRQLVAPALVLALASPWRRKAAALYGGAVTTRAALEVTRDPAAGVALLGILPAMHLSWGAGFLLGLASPPRPAT